jgi:signal peptidase II
LKKPILLIVFILIADQILKFWIKLTMTIGEEFSVFDHWFYIHFTENEGMAFGMTFGGESGKLALSLFRIVAIGAIGWYLSDLIRKKANTGLIISISLILAGALGNMIDSAFYGLIFSSSSYHTMATFLPEGGGYASFLHGKVVDMFYFPIIEGHYPTWLPFWGGDEFVFFRPVFNIADSSITTGVLILLLFQRKFFMKPVQPEEEQKEGTAAAPVTENEVTEPQPEKLD